MRRKLYILIPRTNTRIEDILPGKFYYHPPAAVVVDTHPPFVLLSAD